MITTGHKSPEQLYTAWCLLLQNLNIDALDFGDVVGDNYGVDLDDTRRRTDAQDALKTESSSLIATDIRALKSVINPLDPSDNFGIDVYEETLRYTSLIPL